MLRNQYIYTGMTRLITQVMYSHLSPLTFGGVAFAICAFGFYGSPYAGLWYSSETQKQSYRLPIHSTPNT